MKEYSIGTILDKDVTSSNVGEGDNNFSYKEVIYNVKTNNDNVKVYSSVENLQNGDNVYIQKTTVEGHDYYTMGEYFRYPGLIASVLIFLFIVFFLFGKKALKSILSLVLSFIIIFFVLIPLTIKGYNPIMVSSFISIIMLSAIMFVTHGYNKVTGSALLGSYISIIFTIIFSFFIITISKITGNIDDISTYLSINTNNSVNLTLLVISSIIIGVIGVVDDATITQASVVRELKSANPNLNNLEYYKRAMKVGASHSAAMINTLVLAYVSSSLPLLLLFYTGDVPVYVLLNSEIVFTEIIRSLIGSSGLLLSIPLTTMIAVKFLNKHDKIVDSGCFHGIENDYGKIEKIINEKLKKVSN